MIRIILIVLFLLLYAIFSIPAQLIEWLIGKWKPEWKAKSSLRIVQFGFHCVTFLSGVRLTVIGAENVPRDQPVVYIGNHRSFFDIVLTYSRVPGLTGYIAKKELEKIPLLSGWMRNLYCLFLDRTDLRQGLKTILTAIDYVKSGISIMIFPEGTRSKGPSELEMLEFHEGSFKVAAKTGCLIIPVAISGTSAVFEDHLPKVKAMPVIIEYGKPINPRTLSREDQKFMGKYTRSCILEMLQKNEALLNSTAAPTAK